MSAHLTPTKPSHDDLTLAPEPALPQVLDELDILYENLRHSTNPRTLAMGRAVNVARRIVRAYSEEEQETPCGSASTSDHARKASSCGAA
jgi:hypothetical protein